MKTVVCPGSFDPVTNGHLDILKRASKLFDKVIALVVINPGKQPSFTPGERVEMLKKVTKDIPNIEVEEYQGLLADYIRERGISAIVKGLRAMSDFEYEFQMAMTNKKLVSEADTLFLATSIDHMYLSSGLVKQVAAFNGDISGFVPNEILGEIQKRLNGKNQKNNIV